MGTFPRSARPASPSAIAIVGGGASAVSAAGALRELGYDGSIRLFCRERAAPYDRTTLSKSFMTGERQTEPPLLLQSDGPSAVELSLGAEVCRVDAAAHTLTTSSGETSRFDSLLIAPGARCRRLRIPGAELAGIHYLHELDDAAGLRTALQPGSRVVVVGGGVIGLELAASAVRRGCSVTVVEAAPGVMGRVVPPELAEAVAAHHRERGVAVHTGTPPEAFDGVGDRVCGVRFGGRASLPADVVVVGVGVVPRDELARQAGIAVDDGILADELFRTTRDGIYACGDAANVFHAAERRRIRTESWTPAYEQGRRVAENILGVGAPYDGVPWMWSEQHELTIQATGFGFDGADVIRRGDLGDADGVCYLGLRDGRLVAAAGASYGARIGRTIRLAQLLIESRAAVDAAGLRAGELDLRQLLRSATPA